MLSGNQVDYKSKYSTDQRILPDYYNLHGVLALFCIALMPHNFPQGKKCFLGCTRNLLTENTKIFYYFLDIWFPYQMFFHKKQVITVNPPLPEVLSNTWYGI